MFTSYSKLATAVYDLDKPLGHSFKDVEYYQERLRGMKKRILEVAVGSGRMLIPLLEAGLIVDGVDNSSEMLASCKARCAELGLQPMLYEEDMQSLSLPHQYGAIIIPAGSFQLLEDREDALQVLDSFYHHLQPGGRLILDLFIPEEFTINQRTTRSWITPEKELITLETTLVEVDLLQQKNISYLRYEKWCKGKLIETELQRLPIRWYGMEEFQMILKSIGFTQITRSGGYQYGKEPVDSHEMITYEAIKP
ncbi:class I SAM-dependent methyltransferase [Rubeoparvulum massiliense]|uniref:class I SAM-dependent methyltransferase n=1 Tax=Rubeoparvulum massiliense TaxID=1631346 RepID=UPI00065E959C|nr:class I SAM-dependent methyltransferase [Rubeoparvulum massiliense]